MFHKGKPEKTLKRVQKLIALGLSVCLLLSSAADAAVMTAPRPVIPSSLNIPEENGTIEEFHPGSSGKTVIFIQDAHDVLQAQENIAAMITSLVEKGEVKTVYEEGYEGPVPTDSLFKNIHDPGLKRKVAYYYLDQLKIGGAEYAHINRSRDFRLIGADSLQDHFANVDWYARTARVQEDTENNFLAVEKELENLMRALGLKPLQEFLRVKKRFEENKTDFVSYLREVCRLYLASPASKGFERDYPAVTRMLRAIDTKQADLLERAKQTGAAELFPELKRLEDAMAGALLESSRDRQLYQYWQTVSLLRRMNKLEVTPEEYRSSQEVLGTFKTQQLADFLAHEGKRTVVLSRRWEEGVKCARGFYDTAIRRDEKIREAIEGFSKKPEEKTAVLVYGGFHSERIRKIFEDAGMSYAIAVPKVTQLDERHREYYRLGMSAGTASFFSGLAAGMARPITLFEIENSGMPAVQAKIESQILRLAGIIRDLSGDLPQMAREADLRLKQPEKKPAGSGVSRSELRIDRDLDLEDSAPGAEETLSVERQTDKIVTKLLKRWYRSKTESMGIEIDALWAKTIKISPMGTPNYIKAAKEFDEGLLQILERSVNAQKELLDNLGLLTTDLFIYHAGIEKEIKTKEAREYFKKIYGINVPRFSSHPGDPFKPEDMTAVFSELMANIRHVEPLGAMFFYRLDDDPDYIKYIIRDGGAYSVRAAGVKASIMGEEYPDEAGRVRKHGYHNVIDAVVRRSLGGQVIVEYDKKSERYYSGWFASRERVRTINRWIRNHFSFPSFGFKAEIIGRPWLETGVSKIKHKQGLKVILLIPRNRSELRSNPEQPEDEENLFQESVRFLVQGGAVFSALKAGQLFTQFQLMKHQEFIVGMQLLMSAGFIIAAADGTIKKAGFFLLNAAAFLTFASAAQVASGKTLSLVQEIAAGVMAVAAGFMMIGFKIILKKWNKLSLPKTKIFSPGEEPEEELEKPDPSVPFLKIYGGEDDDRVRSELRMVIPEQLVGFQYDKGLARDENVIVTVKGMEQSATDERALQSMLQPGPQIIGGAASRPYKEGRILAVSLKNDSVDETSSLWSERVLEPHDVDFSGARMAVGGNNTITIFNRKTGRTKIYTYPWFAHIHTVQFSQDGRYLLVASTGFDAAYEIDTYRNRIVWEWNAWEHGYNQSRAGNFLTRSEEEARQLEAEHREVVWVKDPAAWGEFGIPTRQRAVHLNSAMALDSGKILISLFHRGETLVVDKASGQTLKVLTGFSSPHGFRKIGDDHYLITSTRDGKFQVFDSKFEPVREITLSGMPGVSRPAQLGEWLQNVRWLYGQTYAAVDIHRSTIWLMDLEHKTYRGMAIPRDWAVQEVRVIPREWKRADLVRRLFSGEGQKVALVEDPRISESRSELRIADEVPPEERARREIHVFMREFKRGLEEVLADEGEESSEAPAVFQEMLRSFVFWNSGLRQAARTGRLEAEKTGALILMFNYLAEAFYTYHYGLAQKVESESADDEGRVYKAEVTEALLRAMSDADIDFLSLPQFMEMYGEYLEEWKGTGQFDYLMNNYLPFMFTAERDRVKQFMAKTRDNFPRYLNLLQTLIWFYEEWAEFSMKSTAVYGPVFDRALEEYEKSVSARSELRSDISSEETGSGEAVPEEASLKEEIEIWDEDADIEGYQGLMKSAGSVLTREEEQVLFRVLHARNLTPEQRKNLFDFLVAKNVNFVRFIAKRMGYRDLEDSWDVIQEGMFGLMIAIKRFDYRVGVKFSTYAGWWVRQKIQAGDTDTSSPVNLTRHYKQKRAHAMQVHKQLTQTLGREPRLEEWAEELGIEQSELIKIISTGKRASSLDAPAGKDGDASSGSFLADRDSETPDEILSWGETRDQAVDMLKYLNPREQLLIKMRFGIGTEGAEAMTLEQIATVLRVTRERIRQIETRAMEKMRPESTGVETFPVSRDHADVFLAEKFQLIPGDAAFDKLRLTPRPQVEKIYEARFTVRFLNKDVDVSIPGIRGLPDIAGLGYDEIRERLQAFAESHRVVLKTGETIDLAISPFLVAAYPEILGLEREHIQGAKAQFYDMLKLDPLANHFEVMDRTEEGSLIYWILHSGKDLPVFTPREEVLRTLTPQERRVYELSVLLKREDAEVERQLYLEGLFNKEKPRGFQNRGIGFIRTSALTKVSRGKTGMENLAQAAGVELSALTPDLLNAIDRRYWRAIQYSYGIDVKRTQNAAETLEKLRTEKVYKWGIEAKGFFDQPEDIELLNRQALAVIRAGKSGWDELSSETGISVARLKNPDLRHALPERYWRVLALSYGLEGRRISSSEEKLAALASAGFAHQDEHSLNNAKLRALRMLKAVKTGREQVAELIGVESPWITDELIETLPENQKILLKARYGIGMHRIWYEADKGQILALLGVTYKGRPYGRNAIKELTNRALENLKLILIGEDTIEVRIRKFLEEHRYQPPIMQEVPEEYGVTREAITRMWETLQRPEPELDAGTAKLRKVWYALHPLERRIVQANFGLGEEPANSLDEISKRVKADPELKEWAPDAGKTTLTRSRRQAFEAFQNNVTGWVRLSRDIGENTADLETFVKQHLTENEYLVLKPVYGIETPRAVSLGHAARLTGGASGVQITGKKRDIIHKLRRALVAEGFAQATILEIKKKDMSGRKKAESRVWTEAHMKEVVAGLSDEQLNTAALKKLRLGGLLNTAIAKYGSWDQALVEFGRDPAKIKKKGKLRSGLPDGENPKPDQADDRSELRADESPETYREIRTYEDVLKINERRVDEALGAGAVTPEKAENYKTTFRGIRRAAQKALRLYADAARKAGLPVHPVQVAWVGGRVQGSPLKQFESPELERESDVDLVIGFLDAGELIPKPAKYEAIIAAAFIQALSEEEVPGVLDYEETLEAAEISDRARKMLARYREEAASKTRIQLIMRNRWKPLQTTEVEGHPLNSPRLLLAETEVSGGEFSGRSELRDEEWDPQTFEGYARDYFEAVLKKQEARLYHETERQAYSRYEEVRREVETALEILRTSARLSYDSKPADLDAMISLLEKTYRYERGGRSLRDWVAFDSGVTESWARIKDQLEAGTYDVWRGWEEAHPEISPHRTRDYFLAMSSIYRRLHDGRFSKTSLENILFRLQVLWSGYRISGIVREWSREDTENVAAISGLYAFVEQEPAPSHQVRVTISNPRYNARVFPYLTSVIDQSLAAVFLQDIRSANNLLKRWPFRFIETRLSVSHKTAAVVSLASAAASLLFGAGAGVFGFALEVIFWSAAAVLWIGVFIVKRKTKIRFEGFADMIQEQSGPWTVIPAEEQAAASRSELRSGDSPEPRFLNTIRQYTAYPEVAAAMNLPHDEALLKTRELMNIPQPDLRRPVAITNFIQQGSQGMNLTAFHTPGSVQIIAVRANPYVKPDEIYFLNTEESTEKALTAAADYMTFAYPGKTFDVESGVGSLSSGNQDIVMITVHSEGALTETVPPHARQQPVHSVSGSSAVQMYNQLTGQPPYGGAKLLVTKFRSLDPRDQDKRRSELRAQSEEGPVHSAGTGYGEFAVMAGSREIEGRKIEATDKTPVAFYFNIHTDRILTDPSTLIKARVYYKTEKEKEWKSDLEMTLYDNFENGTYRVGVTLPNNFSGSLTFQYSLDGGKTWPYWANRGAQENYEIVRTHAVTARNQSYEVSELPAGQLKSLFDFDARQKNPWGERFWEHLETAYGARAIVALRNGAVAAYLVYQPTESGMQVLKYAVDPEHAPRVLLRALWRSAQKKLREGGKEILTLEAPFRDLKYFGKSKSQHVQKSDPSGKKDFYTIDYYSPLWGGRPAEGGEIPEEYVPSPMTFLRTWAARQKPGTELPLNFEDIHGKYPSLSALMVRRILGENNLKPRGGYPAEALLIREMTDDDLDDVMRIENGAFQVPDRWSPWGFQEKPKEDETREDSGGGLMDEVEEGFNRFKIVAVDEQGRVIGYMVYQIFEERIDIQKMAVDPAHRFSYIGSQMLEHMKWIMNKENLSFISADVPVQNEPVSQFFKKEGFSSLSEQDESWQKKSVTEFVFWHPEIDANLLQSKEQAAKFLRKLREMKKHMEEQRSLQMAKSPKGVLENLGRKETSPWEESSKSSKQPFYRIRIRQAGEDSVSELAAFAEKQSRFHWKKSDFSDFLNRGGKILEARSYGKLIGYLAYSESGQTYEILDAAFAVRSVPGALLRRFFEFLEDQDSGNAESPVRAVWELPVEDFLDAGRNLRSRAGFRFLDEYELKDGRSLYLLEKTLRKVPEGEKHFRSWAQSLERTPVTVTSLYSQAEEFGLDPKHAEKILAYYGVSITAEKPAAPSRALPEEAPYISRDPIDGLYIRWMIRRDMPEVLDIEERSFSLPWTDEDFLRALRQRNVIGMVAEARDQVKGFMVYSLHRKGLEILNFAVDPDERGRKIGRTMVEKLKEKLSAQRRNWLRAVVRESDLRGQIFWRSQGFSAVQVSRGYFEDTGEDAYLFEYRLDPEEMDFDETSRHERVRDPRNQMHAWALRQPLEKLVTAEAAARYPEVPVYDADYILNPVREQKLKERMLELLPVGSGRELPLTAFAFSKISGLPAEKIETIAGRLGLRLKGGDYSPLVVTVRDHKVEDFHLFESKIETARVDQKEPWTFSRFLEFVQQEKGNILTAEYEHNPAGYLAYHQMERRLVVEHMGLLPSLNFRGGDRRLLKQLREIAEEDSLSSIVVPVGEQDLHTQLLLKDEGYKLAAISHPFSPPLKKLIFKLDLGGDSGISQPEIPELKNIRAVHLRPHEGAFTLQLDVSESVPPVILRTSLEHLDTDLHDWFGIESVAHKGWQTLMWKDPASDEPVVRSLISPVEIKDIESFILSAIQSQSSSSAPHKTAAQESIRKNQRSELRTKNPWDLRAADEWRKPGIPEVLLFDDYIGSFLKDFADIYKVLEGTAARKISSEEFFDFMTHFSVTRLFRDKYQGRFEKAIADLLAGDELLLAMFRYTLRQDLGAVYKKFNAYSELANRFMARESWYLDLVLRQIDSLKTKHLVVVVMGPSFGQELFFWAWLLKRIKSVPGYSDLTYEIVGYEKFEEMAQKARGKISGGGLDLLDVVAASRGAPAEVMRSAFQLMEASQSRTQDFSGAIRVVTGNAESGELQKLYLKAGIISFNNVWAWMEEAEKKSVVLKLKRAAIENPGLALVGVDVMGEGFQDVKVPKYHPSFRSELRAQEWETAADIYRDLDRLHGTEKMPGRGNDAQKKQKRNELLKKMILNFDAAAALLRREMGESAAKVIYKDLGALFDASSAELIQSFVQQRDAKTLRALLAWNWEAVQSRDAVQAFAARQRASKINAGLDEIRKPYVEAYRNAVGRKREAAHLMGLPPKTYDYQTASLGIDFEKIEIPPGTLLRRLEKSEQKPAQAIRKELYAVFAQEKNGTAFNLVEFRKFLAAKPGFQFLRSPGFSYARLLWGLNLAEDFLYEASDRKAKYGGLMIRVGESFGFDTPSAKANIERILKELAQFKKKSSEAPADFDILKALGMTKEEVLRELEETHAWNLKKFADAHPEISWVVTRGYDELIKLLGIQEEAKKKVEEVYAAHLGHLDYAAQGVGITTPAYKRIAESVKVDFSKVEIPAGSLLKSLDAEDAAGKKQELLAWLNAAGWSNLNQLKSKAFENHPYFQEKVFSIAEVIWGLDLTEAFAARYRYWIEEQGLSSPNQIGMKFGWPKGSAKITLNSLLSDSRIAGVFTRSELRLQENSLESFYKPKQKPSAAMIDFRDLVTFTPEEIREVSITISQRSDVRFLIHNVLPESERLIYFRDLFKPFSNVVWTQAGGEEAFRSLGTQFRENGIVAFARRNRDLTVFSAEALKRIRFFALSQESPGTFAVALSYDPDQILFQSGVEKRGAFYEVKPFLADLAAAYLNQFAFAASA